MPFLLPFLFLNIASSSPDSLASLASRRKQVFPKLFCKPQDASADCSSVPSIFPFSPRLRNHLDKVPKPTFSHDLATLWVTTRDPVSCQPELRRNFGTSTLSYKHDALFSEALVSILQCLLIDRLKIRQIALVIQGLAKLFSVSMTCIKILGRAYQLSAVLGLRHFYPNVSSMSQRRR